MQPDYNYGATPAPPAFNNNLCNGGSEWQNGLSNLPDLNRSIKGGGSKERFLGWQR